MTTQFTTLYAKKDHFKPGKVNNKPVSVHECGCSVSGSVFTHTPRELSSATEVYINANMIVTSEIRILM